MAQSVQQLTLHFHSRCDLGVGGEGDGVRKGCWIKPALGSMLGGVSAWDYLPGPALSQIINLEKQKTKLKQNKIFKNKTNL